VHVYRLTARTADREKIEYALHQTIDRPDELRTALQDSVTGYLMPESFFLSNVSWDDGTVRTREFGFYVPPPREPLPEDHIPGFGTWEEARHRLAQAVEVERKGS
jgi:hypothetical protein